MPAIRAAEPGASLRIVGQGDDLPRLQALARRAGVEGRVVFAGPVEDMAAAYAAADLVLAPSTLAESFGRGVVEAGAMGRVVLATPLGGPGETIIDGVTGWLVAPGDARALSDAIARALAAPAAERARMGAAARAHVAGHYSLEAMTTRTFEVYRRLLARSS